MLRRIVAVVPLGTLITSQLLLRPDVLLMEEEKKPFPVLPPGSSQRYSQMADLICNFQDNISKVRAVVPAVLHTLSLPYTDAITQ